MSPVALFLLTTAGIFLIGVAGEVFFRRTGVAAGVPGTEELPTVVFACVLTTVLIFAVGFPLLRHRRGTAPGTVPAPPTPA